MTVITKERKKNTKPFHETINKWKSLGWAFHQLVACVCGSDGVGEDEAMDTGFGNNHFNGNQFPFDISKFVHKL